MYRIYADDALLYSSDIADPEYHLLNPILKTDIGKVSSLTFTIYPSHPLFSQLEQMKTTIRVEEDDEIRLRGRILDIRNGMKLDRNIVVEDALSYLNDSWIDAIGEVHETFEEFLTRCVDTHNAQCSAGRKLYIGNVSHSDSSTEFDFEITSPKKIMDVLNEQLIRVHGGYLLTRHETDKTYIDYFQQFTDYCDQRIALRENLIDIGTTQSGNDIFTAVVPIGNENLKIGDVATYIKFINNNFYISHTIHKDYIELPGAVQKYGGLIFKILNLSDAQTTAELIEDAERWIANNYVYDITNISVKALDLTLIGEEDDKIRAGKLVSIVSTPHGINSTYLCTATAENIQNPDNTTYEFGDPDQQNVGERNRRKRASDNASEAGGVAEEQENQKKQIQVLRKETEEAAEAAEAAEEAAEEAAAAAEEAQNNVAVLATNVGILQSNVAILESNVSILQSNVDIANSNISILKSNLSMLESNVGILKSNIDIANSNISILQSNVAMLESNVSILHSNVDAQWSNIAILYSNVAADHSNIAILQSNVAMLESNISILNSNVDAQWSNISILHSNVATLESNISILNSNVDAQWSNISILYSNLSADHSNIAILQSNVSMLESNVSILNSNIDAQWSNIAILHSNVAADHSNIAILQSNVATLESNISILNSNVDAQWSNISILYSNVSTMESYVGIIRSNISVIDTDISIIQGSIYALDSTLYALGIRVQNIEADYIKTDQLSAQIANLDVLYAKGISTMGAVLAKNVYVEGVVIGGRTFSDCLVGASVDGNTLTLTYLSGETVDFNKAASSITSVTWGWAGGAARATLNPTGQIFYSPALDDISPDTITWADNKKSLRITAKVYDENGTLVYTSPMSSAIYTTEAWDAGYSDAKLSESWNGRTLTVSKSTSGSNSLTYSISAGNSITYNSTSHKYTGTCNAIVGAALRSSSAYDSGDQAYQDGSTAGYGNAKLAESWNGRTLTVSKSTSGSNSLTYSISAGNSITYNSTSHKYTGTCNAIVGAALRSSSAYDSGDQAYQDGVTAGTNSVGISSIGVYGSPAATATSISVQAKATNGASDIGSINITTQRNNAYASGWGACYAKVKLDSTTTTTLTYGGSVTVYAQAASTSSASVGNVQSRLIKAPADRTVTASIDYCSTTHKYIATAYKDNAAASIVTGGTTAYDNGYSAGYSAGATAAGVRISGTSIERVASSGTKYYTISAGTPSYAYDVSRSQYLITATAYADRTVMDTESTYTDDTAWQYGYADGYYKGMDDYVNTAANWDDTVTYRGNGYYVGVPNSRNTGMTYWAVDATQPYEHGASSVYSTGVTISSSQVVGNEIYVYVNVYLSNGNNSTGVFAGSVSR